MITPLLLATSLLAVQPVEDQSAAAPATEGTADDKATFDLPDWVEVSCTAEDAEGDCPDVGKRVIFGYESAIDIRGGIGAGRVIASTGGTREGSETRWARRVEVKRPACERTGIGGVKRTAVQLVGTVFRANTIGYRHAEAATVLSIYGQRAGDSKSFYIVRIDFQSFGVASVGTRIACGIDVDSYRTWRNPDNSRVIDLQDSIANTIYQQLMTRLDATD